jgi:decaprenylphospho-beta-D-erythro-pentofuranosid-2-ulose 2-reductase
MPTLLVLGGNSEIAKAVASRYAENGYDIQLAGRQPERFSDFASDLAIRHSVTATVHELDVLNIKNQQQFFQHLPAKPDVLFCAIGLLGNQVKAQSDHLEGIRIIDSNFTALTGLLEIAAERFIEIGQGAIIVVSSVAGERGRQSNYFYGAAKAGLSAYLAGLRQRLTKNGIQVLTIKPGFVQTRMLKGMQTPAFLTIEPMHLAQSIFKAHHYGRNVVYSQSAWRIIMSIIKTIPESLFKRLSL